VNDASTRAEQSAFAYAAKTNSNLETALTLAEGGKAVFPCRAKPEKVSGRLRKAKTPLTRNGFKDASTDPGVIRAWWTRWSDALVGLPTGSSSGVYVIDPDAPTEHREDGLSAFAALEQQHGAINTLIVRTPGGGRHYYFQFEEGYTNAEGDLPPGCEARGEGGYVIAPGSRLPDGRAWQIEIEAEIIPIPDWLAKTVRSYRVRPTPDPKEPMPEFDPGETKPGLRALEKICSRLIDAPNGKQHKWLYNLGAAAGNLVAAGDVFEKTARDRLLAAAKKMPDFREEEPWTEDGLLYHINNGLRKGKRSPLCADRTSEEAFEENEEATRRLYEKLGMEPPKREPESEPGAKAKTKPEPSDWAPVNRLLLSRVLLPAPELTDEATPSGWASWVRETAFEAHTLAGYVNLNLIVTATSAIGNVRTVVATGSWYEPIILWGATVGVPAANKSGALNPFQDVMKRIEREAEMAWKAECRRIERQHEMETANIRKGRKPKPPELPPMPRWRVVDTTTENLAERSAENPRGLYVCLDELSAWFGAMGRYGNQADRPFYLMAYGAQRYIRDRQSNPDKKPIVADRLSVSVCGPMVPEKLNKVFEDVNDGLIARFLFDWSEMVPPRELERDTNAAVWQRMQTLQRALERLRNLPFEYDRQRRETPKGIPLSSEAFAAFNKARLEMLTWSQQSTGVFAEWLGKTDGRILRLALTFEYLRWALGVNPDLTRETEEGPEPAKIEIDAQVSVISVGKRKRT
jgi:hypothetical protein